MLKHHSLLLSSEDDAFRRKLVLASRNIEELIAINQDLNSQVTAEALRANGSFVRLVQIGNGLRRSRGIDIFH